MFLNSELLGLTQVKYCIIFSLIYCIYAHGYINIVGLIQSPARQIVERFKSVMQIRESVNGKKAYSWSGACAMELIKREGLRNGLFQGFTSVLWREIPQFAIYYPSYELSKKYYSEVS